jgi:hemerythrin
VAASGRGLIRTGSCPDTAAHTAAHDRFRQRVLAVDPVSVGASRALLTSLRQCVEQWIEEHIQHTDRRLAECIRGAGV